MKRPVALLMLGAAVVALIAAGCGSSGSKSSSASNTSTQVANTSGTVSLASTGLGKVLVGPNGHTLYLFEKDKGGKSACSGACAADWPPLTTSGKPKAGAGVNSAMLSTTKRFDGNTQVVYAGHPLYFYAADTKAGDTTGQNVDAFGAEWYVLSASGNKVSKTNGSSGGGSSQSGTRY
jgi:predicted lipoprotein with Yx(FWY)xxD motif